MPRWCRSLRVLPTSDRDVRQGECEGHEIGEYVMREKKKHLHLHCLHIAQHVLACVAHIIGIMQEYLVITNAYNGDFLETYIPEDLEYALIDVIIMLMLLAAWHQVSWLELLFALMCFVAHVQWYVHSPFRAWPHWWPASKPQGDYRHRTEFYDTHAIAYSMHAISLAVRSLRPVKYPKNNAGPTTTPT